MNFLIILFTLVPTLLFSQNDALYRIRDELIEEINQIQLRGDGLFIALMIIEREIEFDKMKVHEQE